MCGIIGYAGSKNSVPYLIGGLEQLEYRGYDSAGLAVISQGAIQTRRSVGKVKLLRQLVAEKPISGTTGLGHTRWATHGKPSEVNAHPHTDCSGNIVVVHNGIIENYIQLKQQLIGLGHIFQSETDTEVLAHLIEEKVKALSAGGRANREGILEPILFEAVRRTLAEVEGSFAIGVLWAKCPGTIIGARKQSPLVVGLGDGENFLASDVPAFLDHTRKVIFLNDGDMAVIKPSGVAVFGQDGKKTEPTVTTVQWDRSMAEKGGYRHFMLKEIHEQPSAVEDTLRGRLAPVDGETLEREFGLTPDYAKKISEIQLVACGTAYHAALVAKYVLEHFTKIPVSVDVASEYRYREPLLDPNTLVVAVSQSGETADTLAALRESKKRGLRTLAICNVLGASITREAHHTFYTHCGPEIGVASTKAFVGQLTAFYVLALHLAAARGTMDQTQCIDYAKRLMHVPALMRKALELEPKIKELAKKLSARGHYLFIARHVNYPIALEGALKIKEISYVHAEGFAGGEMKHGPIAIIYQGCPDILWLSVRASSRPRHNPRREHRRSPMFTPRVMPRAR